MSHQIYEGVCINNSPSTPGYLMNSRAEYEQGAVARLNVQHGLWPAVSRSRWGPSEYSILLDRAATTTTIIYNSFFSQVGPIQVLNPLGQSRHHHHHHLQQLLFSVRRCPCSRSPLNIRELRNQVIVYPRQERELLGSPLFPWILGWDEEAIRPQYWRDLGAVEEQRREETRAGGSRNCFPIVVTFVCFKVKVGAI